LYAATDGDTDHDAERDAHIKHDTVGFGDANAHSGSQ
jgi:hypothetical protein